MENNWKEVVSLLLDAHADPNIVCDAMGKGYPGATPLHWAVAGTRRRPNGFGTGGHPALLNTPREGVARISACAKAHDARSFHPGQAGT